MSMIIAKEINVVRGASTLVEQASLSLRTGELIAIIGPNGAGKTTLVRALLGLQPSSGEITVDDKPSSQLSSQTRAKTMAYVPQGQGHAWPLPVRDVVALGRYPHRGEDEQGLVDEIVERCGLIPFANRPVTTLSGGEQMKVAIARALAVEARFLIADEPLAALDPLAQFEVMNILWAEAKNGVGVVTVLHDLRLAATYADRLILMNKARIVASGPPEEVLTPENLMEVFNVRSGGVTLDAPDGPRVVALPEGPATPA